LSFIYFLLFCSDKEGNLWQTAQNTAESRYLDWQTGHCFLLHSLLTNHSGAPCPGGKNLEVLPGKSVLCLPCPFHCTHQNAHQKVTSVTKFQGQCPDLVSSVLTGNSLHLWAWSFVFEALPMIFQAPCKSLCYTVVSLTIQFQPCLLRLDN
jgi:hypothetical protein